MDLDARCLIRAFLEWRSLRAGVVQRLDAWLTRAPHYSPAWASLCQPAETGTNKTADKQSASPRLSPKLFCRVDVPTTVWALHWQWRQPSSQTHGWHGAHNCASRREREQVYGREGEREREREADPNWVPLLWGICLWFVSLLCV